MRNEELFFIFITFCSFQLRAFSFQTFTFLTADS